jgi:ethanolamine ammonia-lyase large subunit
MIISLHILFQILKNTIIVNEVTLPYSYWSSHATRIVTANSQNSATTNISKLAISEFYNLLLYRLTDVTDTL